MKSGLLARHRSIRRFKPEKVPEDLLWRVLAEAQRAPTDATAQMYSLVRITDPTLRQRISQACGGIPVVEGAPEFFLICADLHRVKSLLAMEGLAFGSFPHMGLHFATVDATLVAQRLMDAAEAAGLGVCPIGAIVNGISVIPELCAFPPLVMPLFGVCLGYPDEDPADRPRVPLTLVVHENLYRHPDSRELREAAEVMNPITRSGSWLGVLRRYFESSGIMEEREASFAGTLKRQGFGTS